MNRAYILVLVCCLAAGLASPQQRLDPGTESRVQPTPVPPCSAADKELMSGLKMERLGDSFYYFSEYKRELKLSWGDSLDFCRARGLQLASIQNEAENRLVAAHAHKLGAYWDFWLGGTDAAREGRWLWSDSNSPNSPVTFSAWRADSPNNFGADENCLEIWTDEGVPNWNDDTCSDRNRFVCKLQKPCIPDY